MRSACVCLSLLRLLFCVSPARHCVSSERSAGNGWTINDVPGATSKQSEKVWKKPPSKYANAKYYIMRGSNTCTHAARPHTFLQCKKRHGLFLVGTHTHTNASGDKHTYIYVTTCSVQRVWARRSLGLLTSYLRANGNNVDDPTAFFGQQHNTHNQTFTRYVNTKSDLFARWHK